MATFKTFFGFSTAPPLVGTHLDPAKTSSLITLSNENLTATRTGAAYYATTLSDNSADDNVYVEITNTVITDSGIGISNTILADSSDGSTNWLGFDTNSIALYSHDYSVYHNGALLGSFTVPPIATDVIGIQVYRPTQQIWFRNVTTDEWLPPGDGFSIASLGTGALYLGLTLAASDSKTVNFDGAFVGVPPPDATRWDGTPIVAGAAYTLTAETGSVALTGQVAGLRVARKLTAASGAIALTGQTTGLRAVRKLLAAPGAIVLTGIDTTLTHGTAARVLVAARGTFILAGQAAGLRRSYTLAATKGTLALTGIPTNLALRHAYRLAADTGTFVLTGKDANLLRVEIIHRTLYAATGVFRLTGTEAFLTSSAPYYPVSLASLMNRTYHHSWR